MFQSSTRVTLLTVVGLLCGQGLLVSGSVSAEDTDPVAADLVPLAIAIPEAVATAGDSEAELALAIRLQEKGALTKDEVEALQRQNTKASRTLELLRFIIDAELKATTTRAQLLQARHKNAGVGSPDRIIAAEQRLHVLSLLKEACKISKAGDEQAALLQRDLPPFEPMLAWAPQVVEFTTP